MMKIIALLGRPDEPTDAVEAYCGFLHAALSSRGVSTEVVRVGWHEHGWAAALQKLRANAEEWHGSWVFLQYTALAWSARGFPWRLLRILSLLRRAGARVGVVYHDPEPFTPIGGVGQIRRLVQVWTMKRALRMCDLAVFTVAPEKLSWLKSAPPRGTLIPVGANLPSDAAESATNPRASTIPTVSVFGVTGGRAGQEECTAIASAVAFAAREIGQLRLVVFGRNADSAEPGLRAALANAPVESQFYGVVPAEEIRRILCSCDVLLFVRGPISTRRGSAIAGIACGLPIIGWAGPETGAPITDAGIVFVEPSNTQQLGEALTRVLRDRSYRQSLADRSRDAQRKYFSWEVIAESYLEAMKRNS